MTSFPNSVWDGDSSSRDSDDGKQSSPDHRDWARGVHEIAAIQQHIIGHDHDRIGYIDLFDGLTVDEAGNAALHKSRFVFDDVIIIITDAGATGAHGKIKLYTFTDGHACIYSIHINLNLKAGSGGIKNNAVLDIGVGTDEVGTGNEILSLTEQDILSKIDVTLQGGKKLVEGSSMVPVDLDEEMEIFLNVAIENASCTSDDTLKLNGTVTIAWSNTH